MATELKKEVLETMATLITTAFGLVAALAWNEAIQVLIEEFISPEDALVGVLIYAILVTLLAVIATILIARSLARLDIEISND